MTDEVPPAAPTTETATDPAVDPAAAPFPELRDRLAVGWQPVVCVAAFAALFVLANNVPLFHSDLWGHVAYGRWMLEHRELPTEDPFVELAEGVPLVNSAWLSQVLFAVVERLAGPEGLSSLYAVVVTGTYIALYTSFRIRARRVADGVPGRFTGTSIVALLMTAFVLVVAASRILVIRPEILGNLGFALLLVLSARLEHLDPAVAWRRDGTDDEDSPAVGTPWLVYVLTGLLFVVWANLHGSYLVGLAFVACQLIGRIVEALWRTRSLTGLLYDPGFRRWLVIVEIASLASFVNPYGPSLLVYTASFASHPNLATVLEWERLHAGAVGAMWFGLSLVVLACLLRLGRTPLRAADVLLLAFFAGTVVLGIRMVGWWAAVLGFTMIPQLTGLVAECCRRSPDAADDDATDTDGGDVAPPPAYRPMTLAGPSLAHTAMIALIVWMGFAFSPISNSILGKGRTRPAQRLFSEDTPLALTRYLHEHPPQGMVYEPQWWGDWLALHGPAGFRPFVTTNVVHVLPHQVWLDTQQIQNADPGWERLLTKYGVTTLIVDEEHQPRLADRARDSSAWTLTHEGEQALVFVKSK